MSEEKLVTGYRSEISMDDEESSSPEILSKEISMADRINTDDLLPTTRAQQELRPTAGRVSRAIAAQQAEPMAIDEQPRGAGRRGRYIEGAGDPSGAMVQFQPNGARDQENPVMRAVEQEIARIARREVDAAMPSIDDRVDGQLERAAPIVGNHVTFLVNQLMAEWEPDIAGSVGAQVDQQLRAAEQRVGAYVTDSVNGLLETWKPTIEQAFQEREAVALSRIADQEAAALNRIAEREAVAFSRLDEALQERAAAAVSRVDAGLEVREEAVLARAERGLGERETAVLSHAQQAMQEHEATLLLRTEEYLAEREENIRSRVDEGLQNQATTVLDQMGEGLRKLELTALSRVDRELREHEAAALVQMADRLNIMSEAEQRVGDRLLALQGNMNRLEHLVEQQRTAIEQISGGAIRRLEEAAAQLEVRTLDSELDRGHERRPGAMERSNSDIAPSAQPGADRADSTANAARGDERPVSETRMAIDARSPVTDRSFEDFADNATFLSNAAPSASTSPLTREWSLSPANINSDWSDDRTPLGKGKGRAMNEPSNHVETSPSLGEDVDFVLSPEEEAWISQVERSQGDRGEGGSRLERAYDTHGGDEARAPRFPSRLNAPVTLAVRHQDVAEALKLGARQVAKSSSLVAPRGANLNDFARWVPDSYVADRDRGRTPLPGKLTTPVDLEVHFSETSKVRNLGARFDGKRKIWYAPEGSDLGRFERWVPASYIAQLQEREKATVRQNDEHRPAARAGRGERLVPRREVQAQPVRQSRPASSNTFAGEPSSVRESSEAREPRFPSRLNAPVNLAVRHQDVAEALKLGARQIAKSSSLVAPRGANLNDFARWVPDSYVADRDRGRTPLPGKLTTPVDLDVHYNEHKDARERGARFDGKRKIWYAPEGSDLGRFERWVPASYIAQLQERELAREQGGAESARGNANRQSSADDSLQTVEGRSRQAARPGSAAGLDTVHEEQQQGRDQHQRRPGLQEGNALGLTLGTLSEEPSTRGNLRDLPAGGASSSRGNRGTLDARERGRSGLGR